MFEEIVGASAALKTVLSHVSKVAPTDSTVLISSSGQSSSAPGIRFRSTRPGCQAMRHFGQTGLSPLPETLQDQEKDMIEAALAKSRGRVAGPRGAAARLGIPASTLESKIEQLKIEKKRFTTAS
jgi:transcriptional regulator with GAF, ATPase, and Fis domain